MPGPPGSAGMQSCTHSAFKDPAAHCMGKQATSCLRSRVMASLSCQSVTCLLAGFLRKKDHVAAYGEGAVLEVGALLECVVQPGSKGRVVKVTTDPQPVVHTVTKEWEGLTIGELTYKAACCTNWTLRALKQIRSHSHRAVFVEHMLRPPAMSRTFPFPRRGICHSLPA